MTITDRFIVIDAWAPARKTALLAGLLLAGHLVNWAFLHLYLLGREQFDVDLIDTVMAWGSLSLATCLLLGLAATRSDRWGRTTPYVAAVLLICPSLALQAVFGQFSSTMFLLMPITVLLMVLWYGVAPALTMYGTGFVTATTIGALQSDGALRYAPALRDLSLEEFGDPVWTTTTTIPVQTIFWLTLLLCALLVRARHQQESRLAEARDLLERSNAVIRRYVPAQVADRIMASTGDPEASTYERRRVSVFFSDLVGFTEISEELEPEDLSRVLNEYFSAMTAIAGLHGGTVDELQGDALLILFGAPDRTDDHDHAVRAVEMAVAMQRAMPALNASWADAGIPVELQVRMGINTGVVTVGSFGSPDRMKYAALGKHVNLAARLQSHSRPGSVLLGHSTWLLVRDRIVCVPEGEVTLKGIVRPVPTYSPEALRTATSDAHDQVP